MLATDSSAGRLHGTVSLLILLANFVINSSLQFVILKTEKGNDNIDKKVVKKHPLFVSVVHLMSTNHLSCMALWTWKESPYYGFPSRRTFKICRLTPLFVENLPQLVTSISYLLATEGEADKLVVGSAVTSTFSILFTLLGSLSVSLVMDDEDASRRGSVKSIMPVGGN